MPGLPTQGVDPQPATNGGSTIRRWWFPAVVVVLGLYAWLPWMAPVFMRLGWVEPAEAIYAVYSTQCHQLANRSYFLFGPKPMYSPQELQVPPGPNEMLALRAFRGSPEVGWKVAWSDRMVGMYSGLFFFVILTYAFRRRLPALPTWAFLLALLPLALDGTSHFISDLYGFGQGFRDTNLWLATLTGGGLGSAFYVGDAWGSFNSIMRLLTGLLFGLGAAWFAIPQIVQSLEVGEGDLRRASTSPAHTVAADPSGS